MSHELMKLKRILPTINGKRTELLFDDNYYLPDKSSTTKSVAKRMKQEKVETAKPQEDNSFHPVKESIKHLIEDKFTNIHDLLTNEYEEQKFFNTPSLQPGARRPMSKAITLTIDRSANARPAIIHSRPTTQQAVKLHGALGRNHSQQGISHIGMTTTTSQFGGKKEFLFSLDGKKVIKLDDEQEERPMTHFSSSTRPRKYLTFSERFGPRRNPKSTAVPEVVTRYDRFMSDNPMRKSYSRRLKDSDSFFMREMQRRREIAIQDRNYFVQNEGFVPLNTNEGLMVNSKSATLFRSNYIHNPSEFHEKQGI